MAAKTAATEQMLWARGSEKAKRFVAIIATNLFAS